MYALLLLGYEIFLYDMTFKCYALRIRFNCVRFAIQSFKLNIEDHILLTWRYMNSCNLSDNKAKKGGVLV